MPVKLKNNARSVLTATLSENDTMVRIRAGHGQRFPELNEAGSWFPLAVTDESGEIEYMHASVRLGDTIVVSRGEEGSKRRRWESGSPVYLPLTVAALNDLTAGTGSGVAPLTLSIDDTKASA